MSITVDPGPTQSTARGPLAGWVLPGEPLPGAAGCMLGHGTRDDQTSGEGPVATVAGRVERVNQLVRVAAVLGGRYRGEVGEVVIGQVTALQVRRWRLDVGATSDGVLQLSAINLPGGVLRRRTDLDALQMRKYFVEGDLVVCEVQSLHADGGLALHTRSLKYGKVSLFSLLFFSFLLTGVRQLRGGTVVRLRPSQMGRASSSFAEVEGGDGDQLLLIVGANGLLWAGPRAAGETADPSTSSSTTAVGIPTAAPSSRRKAAALAALARLLARHGRLVTAPRVAELFMRALAAGVGPAQWEASPEVASWLLSQH